jgi:probable F420-dependent oxidoreductase
MPFSIQLFGLPPHEYGPLVEHADALGFHTVWLADHVITPLRFRRVYPYKPGGDPGYRPDTPLADVAVTLAYLAARTQRIRLGSGVLILPLRNPFHVAQAWATLQHLSGGRAVLGVGSGWMAEEFDALGEDFAARGTRLDEALDVLGGLWSGAPVAYQGRHFAFPDVRFAAPPPVPVPVVVGGHAPPALRRAARRADGWFGPDVDLATSLRLTRRIDELRERAGRGDVPFTHYVRLVGELAPATVAAYREAGLDHLVFSPFTRLPRDASLADRIAALDAAAERLAVAEPS